MPLQLKPEMPYYNIAEQVNGVGIYKAIIQQSGTDAPIATILQNTLQLTDPIWTYDSTGHYQCTLEEDLPTTTKWSVEIGSPANDSTQQGVQQVGNNIIELRQATTSTLAGVDGMKVLFTLQVYSL